jgi:integrase
MRVFKASFKDRKGRSRKSSKWYVELKDHLEAVRRFVGFRDKRATEELGRKLERLVANRVSGRPPDAELARWVEGLPSKLRDRLLKIGLLDSWQAASANGLAGHLLDFKKALAAAGNTEKHVTLTYKRAKRVLDGIKAVYWSDIRPSAVQGFLAALRDGDKRMSIQTSNHHLRAVKQFCRWMVRDKRASEDPVVHLKGGNVKTDRRHIRRALTPDECTGLIRAARQGSPRSGMTGPERAALYSLAIQTGLRSVELRSLTPESFDFKGRPPTVKVLAAHSKHRREDTVPLRADLAKKMDNFVRGKAAGEPVFPMPEKTAVVRMFRSDLKAAGIKYRDASDRVADFHSLRVTFASILAQAGVHPKTAQDLMRHSDVNLTMNYYTFTVLSARAEALESMPDFDAQTPERNHPDSRGGAVASWRSACRSRDEKRDSMTQNETNRKSKTG